MADPRAFYFPFHQFLATTRALRHASDFLLGVALARLRGFLSLTPPTLGKRRHRCLARRGVAVRGVPAGVGLPLRAAADGFGAFGDALNLTA